MKPLLVLLLMVVVTGCADLTPTQRKVLYVGASVLVVGAIANERTRQGTPTNPDRNVQPVNCTADPNSCR